MNLILAKIKLWGGVVGLIILTVLSVFGATMKGQRDRARREVDTLKTTVHSERVKKKIVKEKKKELSLKESEIKERVKKEKREDFEGIDNLTDNSDDW